MSVLRRLVRPLATAVVGATGLLPAVPAVGTLLTAGTPLPGLVLVGADAVDWLAVHHELALAVAARRS